ncbi:hypothetical protein MtrunA17_Chr7g0224751 [Medicago truncatula]|uniref:Uncharacterized protein n=1 Tax=Medicago truncatula TaxID=3880 RepID=A0A396GV06_MEDTR|nr:hypothetical protein MtrunA17_Chr7g0224751 [Medicago truncatula]
MQYKHPAICRRHSLRTTTTFSSSSSKLCSSLSYRNSFAVERLALSKCRSDQ